MAKVGGGARKVGRNEKKCQQYKSEGRREKNKKLKIARHEKKVKDKKAKLEKRVGRIEKLVLPITSGGNDEHSK